MCLNIKSVFAGGRQAPMRSPSKVFWAGAVDLKLVPDERLKSRNGPRVTDLIGAGR